MERPDDAGLRLVALAKLGERLGKQDARIELVSRQVVVDEALERPFEQDHGAGTVAVAVEEALDQGEFGVLVGLRILRQPGLRLLDGGGRLVVPAERAEAARLEETGDEIVAPEPRFDAPDRLVDAVEAFVPSAKRDDRFPAVHRDAGGLPYRWQ